MRPLVSPSRAVEDELPNAPPTVIWPHDRPVAERDEHPGGTEGFPSCPAASAGNQRLPKRTHAAGRAFTTPGPSEPNQSLWRGKQRAGPQLPRLAHDIAEAVSAAPITHATHSTTVHLITTQRLRLRQA